jgi:glycosyltransferase involved in cell wall biosynthesis
MLRVRSFASRVSAVNSVPLHIVHVIHSLGPGGAEHTLVDLAGAALDQNINMSVVSLMPMGSNPYPRILNEAGVDVKAADLPTRWDPRGLRRGARIIEGLDPDVIHTHLKHADLVGARSARRLDIPMVSTLHIIENTPTAVGRVKRRLAAQARLRTAARTVAVSEPQRTWYLDAFPADPARVVHIPNGVARPVPITDARRRAIRREIGVRPDALMATTVGILRKEKGHAVLLDAARQLSLDIDIQIVVVGDGPERAPLVRQADAADLVPDRVIFAGFREDVPDVLAASELVVHPSLEDALPTALLHALGAGVPIVASDIGGIPEIVTPDVGILVRSGSADALVDGLQQMIERLPAVDMSDAARNRFADKYDAVIWAARLRGLYDEVITEHHRTER